MTREQFDRRIELTPRSVQRKCTQDSGDCVGNTRWLCGRPKSVHIATGKDLPENATDTIAPRKFVGPACVIDVTAGVKNDGTITAWDFHNYNSGGSGLQSPYSIASKNEKSHTSKTPLHQGSYRGLAATANHFARESYMDELAVSAKMDPLEFRLKNAKNERLRNVIEAIKDVQLAGDQVGAEPVRDRDSSKLRRHSVPCPRNSAFIQVEASPPQRSS